MKPKPYRSQMKITHDILQSIAHNKDVKVSHICRIANLSFYAAKEKLKSLIYNELIDSKEIPEQHPKDRRMITVFFLTSKGIDALHAISDFSDETNKLGLVVR